MTFEVSLIVKSALILALVSILSLLLRRASASTLHGIWALGLVGVLALPIAAVLLPKIDLPVLPEAEMAPGFLQTEPVSATLPVSDTTFDVPVRTGPVMESAISTTHESEAVPHMWRYWLRLAWGLGSCVVFLGWILAWLELRRWKRTSTPVEEGAWLDLLGELRQELSVFVPVQLRISAQSIPPMTWGLLRPIILIPAEGVGWTPARRRLVLAHELGHVKRYDALGQILCQGACGIYWFNPLVWYAAHRLHVERERACDDIVLRLGAKAADYAEHLVQIARGLNARFSWTVVPMAHPSQLKARVIAILDPEMRRQRLSRLAACGFLALVVLLTLSAAVIQLTALASTVPVIAAAIPAPAAAGAFPIQAGTSPTQRPTPDANGSIEGTILRDDTSQPLIAAQVLLTKFVAPGSPGFPPPPPVPGTSVSPPQSAVTDAQGKFMLNSIVPGSYRLVVMRQGFTLQEYGTRQAGRTGAGTVLNVEVGTVLKDIVVRLVPTASVNGRVTNASGRPQMGLDVMLLRPFYDSNGSTTFQIVSTAQTDDRGQYRLYWIAPGDYYLAAGPSPIASSAAVSAVAVSAGLRSQKQVMTFYPSVTDVAMAVTIQVKAGIDLSGIDVAVRQSPTYRIRGHVTGMQTANGDINISIVRRQPLPSTFIMAPQGVPARADGSFELSDVEPGQYWVRAQEGPVTLALPGALQLDSPGALAAVTVVSDDVEDVVLAGQRVRAISGRVTVDGRSLPADLQLSISLASAGIRDFTTPSYPASPVSADGTFTQAKIVPGEYQWSVRGLTSALYIQAARLGAADVLGKQLRLPGGDSDLLSIDISSKAAQIEGVVKDDRQAPVARAIVALVPDLKRDRRDLYKSATTDANGNFTLGGIAPGDYKLFAWDDLDANAFFNADLLRPFETKGKALRIPESSRQSADLIVIRTGAPR